MSAPTMPSPTALSGMDPADLASNPYYPPPTSDINGGLPINLDSLRDGPAGSKPFYPYSTLIRYAIKGSPNQKLLLEDIYYAIESRFPYFRTAPSGWKNSVRHNLSLNPCFVKVPRPLTDRGKGSYWTVDDNVDPRTGVHRVRKRRGGKNSAQNADPEAAYEPPGSMGAVEGFSPERYAAGMAVDGAGPSRGPYQYPGFEGVGYPLVAGAGHFEEGEEDQYLPQHDEHGETNWRNVWINELTRMRLWTTEQEKAGLDPEWYRHMVVRLRNALSEPMPGMALAHGAPMPEGHEQA